ncbi:rCG63022 [Rattus norvegicus]|uniref:RCG63022 n=1 Tax=Rattus norvegicus TaxID=10116 RepID=A6IU66_RAT|nr:rCG63022 [Rattus norvegicus]
MRCCRSRPPARRSSSGHLPWPSHLPARTGLASRAREERGCKYLMYRQVQRRGSTPGRPLCFMLAAKDVSTSASHSNHHTSPLPSWALSLWSPDPSFSTLLIVIGYNSQQNLIQCPTNKLSVRLLPIPDRGQTT